MASSSLILEGGGMRGIFTAGVLDYFMDKDLRFDHCIGVSAGSCHGCSYLSRQRGRAYRITMENLKNKHYCSLYSLITTGDLFGVKFAYDEVPNRLYPFDHETFNSCGTAFHVVVTNCITGQAEYPLMKDMNQDIIYVRASSSLPLVSRLVYINGTPYLDGGISDSVPLRFSMEQGYQKPVVILTQPKGYRKTPSSSVSLIRRVYSKYPKMVEAMAHRHEVYNETLEELERLEAEGRVFVIRPEAALDVGRIEKNYGRLDAAYRQGYETAARQFDALLAYLG